MKEIKIKYLNDDITRLEYIDGKSDWIDLRAAERVELKAGEFKSIRVTLKYGQDKNEKIITGLKRISKPGLRVYASKDELPKVLGGLGIAIISTNQGVITDKEARKLNVGGEVLAFVW